MASGDEVLKRRVSCGDEVHKGYVSLGSSSVYSPPHSRSVEAAVWTPRFP